MDIVFYPSSTPSIGSNRSTWKFHVISLTLVAIATTMSIASIVLSVTQWDKSRSLIDDGSTFEGQGPRTTGSSSAVCLPCSAILDAGSTTEERLMYEFYFARHGFNSREEEEEEEEKGGGGGGMSWSSGNKDTCCARGRRKLRWLLTMFLNVRTRQDKKHGLNEGTSARRRCLVFPSVEHSDNGTRCIVGKREAADAAHLTGARAASTTDVGGTDGVLEWTNPSVLQGRVELNIAGRLTCRSEGGGVYFVYSQVYFVEYYDDDVMTYHDERTAVESVTVYVNRFVNQTKRSEVLTQRSESRCSRSTLTSASPCEYTVYAGSLVELTEGDSVYVTVSHPSFVNPDAKVTYFGLQKVT